MLHHASTSQSGWRHVLWPALLVVAGAGFSLGFACATPFAAFAALAALTLDRREALALAGTVWFANQCVGFGALGYPWTAESLAWGIALGAFTLLATEVAGGIARTMTGRPAVVAGTALLGAFAAFQGAVFVACLITQTSVESFDAGTVGYLLLINLAAFAGLLPASRVVSWIGHAGTPSAGPGMTARHA